MVFRDVALVSGFEIFKLDNQRKNNAVKTEISEMLLCYFNTIRRQRRVCICIRTMK